MNRKYFFILNPVAGQGKAVNLEEKLYDIKEKLNIDLEVIFTKEALAGEVIARDLARASSSDCITRIYGCGGDGTLNEIINGAFGYDNVEIGIIPTGTGNDYIRNFGTTEDFLNLEKQIMGEAEKVDIIKYKSFHRGYENERYCINMINIGFDSQVVVTAKKLKKMPLIKGGMAYGLGAVLGIFEKKMADLIIDMDGEKIHDGKALLIAIGKGAYCGGGFKSLVKADIQDGLIDVGLVKACTRRDMLKLLSKYKKGTHLNTKVGNKIVYYDKVSNLNLETKDEDIYISVDGELSKVKRVELSVIKDGIKFINPNSK